MSSTHASSQATLSARVASLTSLTLGFFAANSLLARAALAGGLADAAAFTAVRLGTGALGLAVIVAVARRVLPTGGSWGAALALFVYAASFSLAYVRLAAGPGALVLFGAVQITMIGWSVLRGARPSLRQWTGVAVALAGLAGLTLPGASAPDLGGAALMLAAGVAWGAYSLLGRAATDPLPATAANFARSAVLALPLLLASASSLHLSPAGIGLAAASGALASGVGYSLWYTVLPSLGATRAAVVQLSVPVLTPLVAAALLGEPVTSRLVLAGRGDPGRGRRRGVRAEAHLRRWPRALGRCPRASPAASATLLLTARPPNRQAPARGALARPLPPAAGGRS